MDAIKFGTDGWRGVMRDSLFDETMLLITQSIVNMLKKKNLLERGVIVSYDTRANSRRIAERICSLIAANGVKKLYFTTRDTPTPVLSYFIKRHRLGGGLMITASHNPPEFNGLKFINHNAGPAVVGETREIERGIKKPLSPVSSTGILDFEKARKDGQIREVKLRGAYLRSLLDMVNPEVFERKRLQVIFDPMYGTTRGYVDSMLKRLKQDVRTIHRAPDPKFGGNSPNPIPPNLKDLSEMVVKKKADLGIACDGDGDRVGIIDDKGEYYGTNAIYPILLYNILKKGERGEIARTVITTRKVDAIARDFSIALYETPVGSKWLAELSLKKNLLLAGEGTGGLIFRNHIPERDGIFTGLKIIEVLMERDTSLSSLSREITRLYGRTVLGEINVHCENEKQKELALDAIRRKADEFRTIIGAKNQREFDGMLFEFSNGSWLHMRPSGTEPFFRIVAESTSKRELKTILDKAKEFIANFEIVCGA